MASYSSNQKQEKSLITKSISVNRFGIVIREVSYLDGFSPDYDHSKLKHVGAFHGNAFGEKIGFMTYHPKTGVVFVHQTIYSINSIVSYLMIDYIKRAIGSLKVTISPDLPDHDALKVLFQDPIREFIGNSMVNELSDNLERMYSRSVLTKQIQDSIQEYPLVITFTILYKPSLVGAGEETPHGIYFYPSFSFAKGLPYFVPFAKADGRTVHRMVFLTRKKHVSPFVMLNVDAQAFFINQNDVMCQNQAGYTNIRIVDILTRFQKRIDADLVIPNSPLRKSKGRITMIFSSVTIGGDVPKPARDGNLSIDVVRDFLSQTDKRVQKYIASNHAFYEQHPATSYSISNITVFSYAGRKGKIPGCMFDSFKIPSSKEAYYLTALKYAIQRRTLNASPDLESWTENRSSAWCAAVVMDMLCIYVNWCNYITDIVDHNQEGKAKDPSLKRLIESFDVIRCRDAGDCEDFSREILMTVMELMFNKADFSSTAIQKVRAIMNRFIFVSVLCGVSKAAIGFKDKHDPTVKLSGHECALAVPKYIFFKAISRSDANHPVLSLYSEEERNLGKEDQIYVLEGTGNLFPEPRQRSETYQYLEACIMEDIAPPHGTIREQFFYHPKKDDNFYKRFITFLTPEFFLKFGYRGFEFLVCIEDEKNPGRFLRGVDFLSFLEIDKNPSIRLIESPHIPMKTFRDASRLDDDNFPPTTIEPVFSIPQEMNIIAQQFLVLQPGVSIPQDNTDVFSFQIPNSKKINSSFIESWTKEINARKLNMICYPEAIKMNDSRNEIVGGYTVYVFK